MDTPAKPNPLPKTAALILLTLAGAWLMRHYDAWALTRIDSMSPAAYVEYQRHLHQHGYLYHFIILLIFGGFYLAAVEVISYVIRLLCSKRRNA
jgi:hypothetical protein